MQSLLQKYIASCGIASRRKAEEMIADGRVEVNGKVARASYDVKVGDVLTISLGQRPITCKVLAVAEHALKEDAKLMYEVVE